MKVRSFKELHQDMRDNQAIYPKRGSSLEEICVMNLIDTIHYFDSMKTKIYFSIRDKEAEESFKFFEQLMHQKFDVVESLLKDCNIECFERTQKEKENNVK